MSSKVTTNFMNNNLNSLENFHRGTCPCPTFATIIQLDVIYPYSTYARKTGWNSEDGLQIHGQEYHYSNLIYSVVPSTLFSHE
jgi:hypothetical protein